jgi:predicted acetyltransferase
LERLADYFNYEISVQQLPKLEPHEGGQLERVEASAEFLHEVYEDYAKRYNGMLKRDDSWWNNRIFKKKQGTVVLYRSAQDDVKGYIFYEVKEQVLTIHEMVVLNEEARAGLWKLIANHDSMIDKVIMKASVDDQLAFMLPDPRIKKETVSYFMARIVDVEVFIRQYPFERGESGDPFYLQIADPHAPWNHGIFEVAMRASGEATVRKYDGLSELPAFMAARVIHCGIGTLSTLLVGYQRASFLFTIGRLQGDAAEIKRLERHIPVNTPYLLDFF